MSAPTSTSIPVCPVCDFIGCCVCKIKAHHWPWCKFRNAMACPVAIECEHGYDVCPRCDPCTCSE